MSILSNRRGCFQEHVIKHASFMALNKSKSFPNISYDTSDIDVAHTKLLESIEKHAHDAVPRSQQGQVPERRVRIQSPPDLEKAQAALLDSVEKHDSIAQPKSASGGAEPQAVIEKRKAGSEAPVSLPVKKQKLTQDSETCPKTGRKSVNVPKAPFQKRKRDSAPDCRITSEAPAKRRKVSISTASSLRDVPGFISYSSMLVKLRQIKQQIGTNVRTVVDLATKYEANYVAEPTIHRAIVKMLDKLEVDVGGRDNFRWKLRERVLKLGEEKWKKFGEKGTLQSKDRMKKLRELWEGLDEDAEKIQEVKRVVSGSCKEYGTVRAEKKGNEEEKEESTEGRWRRMDFGKYGVREKK